MKYLTINKNDVQKYHDVFFLLVIHTEEKKRQKIQELNEEGKITNINFYRVKE